MHCTIPPCVSAVVAEILGNLMCLRQNCHCQVSSLKVQHLILYLVIISLQIASFCLISSITNISPLAGVVIPHIFILMLPCR